MSGASIIPISDEQAKAIREALKALQGLGSFLEKTLGTVPQDVVGLRGGDWLKVGRAENLAGIIGKARERLKARGVEPTEPPSLSVVLPILVAAADESRDELQDIWAALLAATADPSRAKSFRIAFIEAAKKMDPMDAAVLQSAPGRDTISRSVRHSLALRLSVSDDEVDVSFSSR